jgi:hypothetical protein
VIPSTFSFDFSSFTYHAVDSMADSYRKSIEATIFEMKSIIETVISRMPSKFKLLSMQQFLDLIGGDIENAIANNEKLARLRATAVKTQQMTLKKSDAGEGRASNRENENVKALELAFTAKKTDAKKRRKRSAAEALVALLVEDVDVSLEEFDAPEVLTALNQLQQKIDEIKKRFSRS